MTKPFLTAEWKHLLMANYAIDPMLLRSYVPRHTELDEYNNCCYISLVGFLFSDTRVKGIRVPWHHTFEEVNLRFYVRYKEGNQWKRGVVFLKEIVPKRAITFIANSVYGEKYATHAMSHSIQFLEDSLHLAYRWKVGRHWNSLSAVAQKENEKIVTNSIEEFITEHYWGFTQINKAGTGMYEVMHPQWKVHPVTSFNVDCSFGKLYGPSFQFLENAQPVNALLAEGSPISVFPGIKLF